MAILWLLECKYTVGYQVQCFLEENCFMNAVIRYSRRVIPDLDPMHPIPSI